MRAKKPLYTRDREHQTHLHFFSSYLFILIFLFFSEPYFHFVIIHVHSVFILPGLWCILYDVCGGQQNIYTARMAFRNPLEFPDVGLLFFLEKKMRKNVITLQKTEKTARNGYSDKILGTHTHTQNLTLQFWFPEVVTLFLSKTQFRDRWGSEAARHCAFPITRVCVWVCERCHMGSVKLK